LLVLTLAGLYALDVVSPTDGFGRNLYLAALGLKAFNTLVFVYLVAGLRLTAARAMMIVLVPDMITVATFTFLAEFGDWYYAVAVTMPIFYAFIVTKNEARGAGIAVALAYVAGVALTGPHTLAVVLVFALKAVVIPLSTFLVANSVEKRRVREESVAQSAAETVSLNDQLRRRVQALQAVSDITEIVHSSLDFDRVGPQVLEIVARAIGVKTCCLFVIDKTRSETLFSASRGTSAAMADMSEVASPAEVGDFLTCVPVFEHDPTMVLFCTTSESLEVMTDEDRLVLSAVASELVVAVENSRLYRLTSRLAVTDELTGLANYRHLQHRLDEELARASRYGKPLSLLMLDADDFKAFNDAYGHVTGDAALADLGSIIRGRVREVDVVARYGGEEFSVILPETDAAGAFVVAEKIREAVELHHFVDDNGERSCHLTVSIGLGTFPAHANDKDGLLREADDALYHAKNGGKNRVRTPRRRPATEDHGTDDIGAVPDEWMGA
jgi:diguanylate cyclase (GGDEF)-like protein